MSTSTSDNSYEFLIKIFVILFNNYIDFDLILEFAVMKSNFSKSVKRNVKIFFHWKVTCDNKFKN